MLSSVEWRFLFSFFSRGRKNYKLALSFPLSIGKKTEGCGDSVSGGPVGMRGDFCLWVSVVIILDLIFSSK